MKITGFGILMTLVGLVIVGLVALPIIAVATSKPRAIERKIGDLGPWKDLGTISSGIYSGTVMKRTDPDTGAAIYVMLGNDGRGGLFVLPATEKK